MPFEKIASRDGVVCRLEDRFGPDEVSALTQVLAGAVSGSRLVIDFGQVRDYQDLAFGALAESVRRCKSSVKLIGLATRQRRILRYLGVELDSVLAPLGPLQPAAQAG